MTTAARPAMCADYTRISPSFVDSSGKHWVTRGANFVIVTTEAAPGAILSRDGNLDEYMVLLPRGTAAVIKAGAEVVESSGDTLSIVPPGSSAIQLGSAGFVYRVFTSRAEDLSKLAGNAEAYSTGAPEVVPLVDWPEPVGGYRLRHYELAEYARTDTPMRLFRSRNLMLNVFLPRSEPRDVRKMTPHSHEDFEQGSLVVSGTYVHHLRYPWVPDMTAWREDEHAKVATPSVAVIPPKVIHTSQSVGSGVFQLVDVFAPPRVDFSMKSGLVCNASEYPMPENMVAPASAE